MKFTLDTTLPEKFNVMSPDAAVGVPFAEAVFAAGGVAAIFGVDDFVTVRRQPGDGQRLRRSVHAAASRPNVGTESRCRSRRRRCRTGMSLFASAGVVVSSARAGTL